MKNLKKVFYLLALIIPFVFITSCKKETTPSFNEDINLYSNSESKEIEGVNFSYNTSSESDENHILKLKFEISLSSKDNSRITINNPKAYGNDLELEEEVLSNYDKDNKDNNTRFYSYTDIVSDTKTLDLYLIIRDGNPICKYRIDLNINSTALSLYSYKEGYTLDNFTYIHNPSYYSTALVDAEYDEACVYGYKPNSTGSLKGYAKYDWTSEEAVATYKQNRIDYINTNDKAINDLAKELKEQGKTIEEIARACSTLRNQIRMDSYKNDPEGLATLKQRNLDKYGHEEGPLPDELYKKYGSWEMVLEKCYSTNAGMDACCGVYDMYYNMYTEFAY